MIRGTSDRRADAQILGDTRPFARANNKVAAWQALSTLACLAALLVLIAHLPLHWVIVPFVIFLGVLTRLFVLQHDAGHQSLFSNRAVNNTVGTCLSFFTGVPYEAWRLEHAWHHSHQGKLSHRGVDRMNSPMTVEEARMNGTNADLRARKISFLNVYFLGTVSLIVLRKVSGGFFQFRPNFRWPFHGRERMRRGIWITNAGHLAYHAVGFAMLGPRWLFVVAAYLVGGGFGASLFWIQHNFERTWHAQDGDWSFTRAALEGSSYLRLGPILRWFTANIGLHHVHHLNPGIPNYQLEAARRAIPELAVVEPLSNDDLRCCYTHVFWDGERGRMVLREEVDKAVA